MTTHRKDSAMTSTVLTPPVTRAAVEDYLAELDDDDFFAVIADARSKTPQNQPTTD